MSKDTNAEVLAQGILAGERRALAKAITLAESSRLDHREVALDILEIVGPHTGFSMRLGISGPPGVGKSTFIEALGLYVVDEGHRVAVLAVDPSSAVSGGSILGDKTRMESLARHQDAFIRPSPARRTLGGVARRTHEAMLLCEAAGFDVIMIETVGVGQSETMVADMTDVLVLLLHPGGGDALQGIKRGIVELAPIVIVNKADGETKALAEQTAADYRTASAARTLPGTTEILPVLTCSARTKEGLAEVWATVENYCRALRDTGERDVRRSEQRRKWLWNETAQDLLERLRSDPRVKAQLPSIEAAVVRGDMLPMTASRHLLDEFLCDGGREEG